MLECKLIYCDICEHLPALQCKSLIVWKDVLLVLSHDAETCDILDFNVLNITLCNKIIYLLNILKMLFILIPIYLSLLIYL